MLNTSSSTRLWRAQIAVAAIVTMSTTLIGGAGIATHHAAGGWKAQSVTVPAAETPPTGHPTATPIAEEPENRLVGLFRGVLIAGMLIAIGLGVAVALLVRGVKRRRSSR